jgi:hypothetical protein
MLRPKRWCTIPNNGRRTYSGVRMVFVDVVDDNVKLLGAEPPE